MKGAFDVAVVGGGLVGGALALGLDAAGLAVALVEPQTPPHADPNDDWDVRVYAVSPGNAAFLGACGVWQRLPRERLSRIEHMRVYGDAPGAELHFSAYDAGLRELAYIVENRRLQRALWDRLARASNVALFSPARCASVAWQSDAVTLQLESGAALEAKLLVGADGADSWVRREAGIEARAQPYGQLGVVANFETAKHHRETAYQWFRGDGVLALLPLPGKRISMVWSTDEAHGGELLALVPQELAERVDAASAQALGALSLLTAPAAFPLKLQRVPRFVRSRLVLVGDAAHNVHPLAGQGVNLGFRDARELVSVLRERGVQSDCGDYALLRRYERARREDVMTLELATHGLQRLFARQNAWWAGARNAGMTALNALPPVKNLLVRHAAA
ncbi:MAG TPA: UbiH/UbiF family hydroxylase [Burkholderiales bacterium]|nr:UbiH/UbiF family hydroxylase [Burkholderiales bacterium]